MLPAPTGGLVSNRNLAVSRGPDMPPGAAVLENWFPTSTGIMARRGSKRWATMADSPILSLFTYISGNQKQLFAADDSGIYDITSVPSPYTWLLATDVSEQAISPDVPGEVGFGEESMPGGHIYPGTTSGDWVVVQFGTAGGNFLVGVNGTDPAFLYDGTTFGATSITFPAGSGLTTADLSYVWVYKNRLFFIQKESLDAWYLPVDSIGGELTKWPMGGVFPRGGVLLWGQAWSLDSGGAGGLSEQCVFTTTEGEVAAYQGLSPDPDQGWTKVGTYRDRQADGQEGVYPGWWGYRDRDICRVCEPSISISE